jgi:hypothetical protein
MKDTGEHQPRGFNILIHTLQQNPVPLKVGTRFIDYVTAVKER